MAELLKNEIARYATIIKAAGIPKE
jgi:hypothetical protein